MERFLFFCLLCLAQSGSIIAQQQVLPGQLPRQSRSGGLIYRCLFDTLSDAEDGNGFPDYWTRKIGIDNGMPFPAHLAVEITPHPNPFSNFVLRMNMEGGAAAVFSPKIPVRSGMSYTLSVFVETKNVVFDDVSLLVAFYGHDSTQPLRTVESKKVRSTNGWQKLVIGPIPADMLNVQSVAIGLLVMPTGRQDYGSQVNFANVEIREGPTVSLEMANDHHLFFTTRELNAECQFYGLDPAQHSVLFTLEDPFGHIIGQHDAELMIGNYPAARFVLRPQNQQDVIHGTATWRNMPIRSPGFYRIHVATPPKYVQTLHLPADQIFDDPLDDIEPLTFAVLSPDSYRPGGDFGWSLDGWTLDEIEQAMPILAQSGLSHLKIPAWLSAETPPKQQEMWFRLCNDFVSHHVRLIGLPNPIPESISSKIPYRHVYAASILENNPALWGESLQPALQMFSLLIKDWQWTSDTDQSLQKLFCDANGQSRFQEFQRLFDKNRFGYGIGLAWNWHHDVPTELFSGANVCLNYAVDTAITPEDAVLYCLEPSAAQVRQSVSISALPAGDYILEDRIAHFVRGLVLLKAAGQTTISLTQPKDEQTGILHQDGTPNELYLPWRQTATLLSGSRLLGSITLPNRSQNYCFDQGGGRCVMVVWNDGTPSDLPVMESLYLGREPEIIDVWGKRVIPDQEGDDQTIPVTSMPIFVTGLNIDVARFRLGMQTNVKTISSIPNQTNPISYSYKNDLALPVSIQMTPKAMRTGDWSITPPSQTFNVEPEATGEGAFDLLLQPQANTGRQLLEYDVKITGIDAPEFTVYDEIQIGNPDVSMEFVSRLTESGDIEVIQSFINNSDQMKTYDCRLTIPNRPLQKSRVTRQGFGCAEYVYIIRRGQDLIDGGVKEMMLRAEPVNDGSGVLGEPMVFTIPLVSGG